VIAFDSNILVRYFAKDDPVQTALAVQLVDARTSDDPGWIAIPVLVELLWVLARTYKLKQGEIIQILERFLNSDDIVVEHEERVQIALDVYRRGHADFADCLIAISAAFAGCTQTFTFNEIAARDAGMELVS
jgi:predicted nucleic-acid-binding protein